MKTEEIIKNLEEAGAFYETYETRTFRGYRNDSDGETQEVEVRISDTGPEIKNKNLRYICTAKNVDTNISSTGNPSPTITGAINNILA